jgi:hypothetical protein
MRVLCTCAWAPAQQFARTLTPPPFPFLRAVQMPCIVQAVQMFIDEKIHYLDIMKLNEACCEAHKADLVALPNLDDIVNSDAWARRWVAEKVASGSYSSKVFAMA